MPNGMYCSAPSATREALSRRLDPRGAMTRSLSRRRAAGSAAPAAATRRSRCAVVSPCSEMPTGCDVSVHVTRGLLDFCSCGKKNTPQRLPVDDPGITCLITQRILNQAGRGVENIALNGGNAERFRLGQRGVGRAGFPDVRSHFPVLSLERCYFLKHGLRGSRTSIPSHKRHRTLRFHVDQISKLALASNHVVVDAASDVRRSFTKHLEEAPRTRAFADFQRARNVAGVPSRADRRINR